MYESIMLRGLLLVIGLTALYLWSRTFAKPPDDYKYIIFMCGLFAIIAAIFAK